MKFAWARADGVWPVFSMFFLEAFVLGNWIPRIPDVKNLFGFSASELGLGLFALAFGTLFAFLFGSSALKKYGLRNVCAVSLPLWSVGIFATPAMPNGYVLGLLLFLTGIAIGMLEIAMNTAADRLENTSGFRLMSKAHGFWSLGSLFGALAGGGIAALGIDVFWHFTAILLPTAVLGYFMAQGIPRADEETRVREAAKPSAKFKLPASGMFLLCLMPVGIMMVEGAFIDWSALFVREVLQGSALASGLIYAAFSTVMAATRLSGDWLLDRYGSLNVARVSVVAASFGIALFAVAPNVLVAFVAALFAGLGTAIFYPLTMTAAARRPGDPEDNVAAMSLFAFTSFMLAPPALGAIADAAGLRSALLLIAPVAATSLLLSSELKKGKLKMVKLIEVSETGGPDVMKMVERDLTAPGPGEAQVRHSAIGINFIDVYFRTGLYPAPQLPFTPGMEGAGEVIAVGDGVTHVAVGERVAYAAAPVGAYSQARNISADRLVKIPDGVSDDQAAAMMLKGMTARYLLRATFRVEPGHTILFHAAAGGVGLIAGQWAKHLGATVIGTAGTVEKMELAKANGYDHVINYRTENFIDRVAEITDGKGCEAVYDSVGNDTFPGSLDCLKPRGMWASFGQSSGPLPDVNLGILAQKGSLFATRPTLFNYVASRGDLEETANDLFDVVSSGAVKIAINQTYDLKDAERAHRDLEDRKTVGCSLLKP